MLLRTTPRRAPGHLISFDQYEEFHRGDHLYLFATLPAFVLSAESVTLFKALYKNLYSFLGIPSGIINPFASHSRSAARLPSVATPHRPVLGIACRFYQQKSYHSLVHHFAEGTVMVSAYADDTISYFRDTVGLRNVLDLFSREWLVRGKHLSLQKCEALCIRRIGGPVPKVPRAFKITIFEGSYDTSIIASSMRSTLKNYIMSAVK